MNAPLRHGGLLDDIAVTVSVELGRTEMALKDVLSLGEESVVALDRLTDELLDVMVNGSTVAKAEVIAQDGKFALRIVELQGAPAKARQSKAAPEASAQASA